ncbi:ankyrin repeat domain-containing protein [Zooshikella marina]|uniref:ankyrin repeat domain-containing protein n=1 Tax=Zooshikella ganghwensis TaxID=202772 RepID=UPI001BAE693E|nr:ankyrin repeat domain-containing protein [Zooshikella ganghwensis]MBU2709388.1 ankyrin repeat domain-containing protein [Zooshikella ganghwensis]
MSKVSLALLFILFSQHLIAGQIHVEVNDGNYEKVHELLNKDKDLVNTTTEEERLKPIHLAAQNCDIKILKLLISSGSPIDPLDKNKASPLLRASQRGQVECVKILITAGANVNLIADENIRPLHLAAMNGHSEVVKLLIQNGADVNVKDITGATPLNMALNNEVKSILRKNGAK